MSDASRTLLIMTFIIGVAVGMFLASDIFRIPSGIASTTTITITFTQLTTVRENVTTIVQGAPQISPQNILCQVYVLKNKEYYSKLFDIVSKANKSVVVVMYVVKYDPKDINDPVNKLLETLVSLHREGVEVKVLVDDETYDSYPETIEYLLSNNISIKLDPKAGITTHAKIVVVDNLYVFIGSHNWTESALMYNNEVSVLIISKEIAQNVLNYINTLWEQGRVSR